MDAIIEKVGNFGYFQAMMYASTCSAMALSVLGMMFMMYGNYNPGWECSPDEMKNSTFNMSFIDELNGVSVDACAAWRKCNNVVYDKDSSTVVTEWNLICDRAWIPSLIITIQMFGVVVGAWLCGLVGDRFGRRASLYSSVAFYGIAHLMCSFSTSWQVFAAMLFLVGAGVGGILTSSSIYHMEFVGNWWRPVLASVPIWSIGCIEFALLVLICRDWKSVNYATAVMSAIIFLPAFWMPESIRWLALQRRYEKIVRVVERMAWWNRKPAVDADIVRQTARSIVLAQIEADKPTYMSLFKTAKLCRYSVKFGLTWIMMALVYYMISFGIKSFSGNFYLNLILFTLTEIPGNFVLGMLANKIGRRFTVLLLFAVSALFSFGVVVCNFIPGTTSDTISLISAVISKTALVGAWGGVLIISTELYPTVVRTLHAGYLNGISRVGTILSPYLISADSSTLYISYTISGILLLCSGILMLSVSESKGRPMADTMLDIKHSKISQMDENNRDSVESVQQV